VRAARIHHRKIDSLHRHYNGRPHETRTLKDGTRDGQLIVVSRDLHTAAIADAIAPTLQRVLDDWAFYAPQLRELYDALNHGRAHTFAFDAANCMAPLPRAFQWADGSAYVNHVELVRARAAPRCRRSSGPIR
jgi:2-keto-4-pentenoate hydratase/2-oxohepta-3-ene-1,7-dioic acid hydratase in catechol pathway